MTLFTCRPSLALASSHIHLSLPLLVLSSCLVSFLLGDIILEGPFNDFNPKSRLGS
jgi:hypothetical protein